MPTLEVSACPGTLGVARTLWGSQCLQVTATLGHGVTGQGCPELPNPGSTSQGTDGGQREVDAPPPPPAP